MFDNIGKKIKKLAEILAIAGMIISIFLGLFYIISYAELDKYAQSDNGGILVEGIIWLIVGPIASWISGFFAYGFGELIDTTQDIKKTLDYSRYKYVETKYEIQD